MPSTPTNTRRLAIAWLIVALLAPGMALISTVKADLDYWLQLAAFSSFSVAAAATSVSALAGAQWVRGWFLALAFVGATYFFGSALVSAFFIAIQADELGATALLSLPVLAIVAAPGGLFVALWVYAHRLGIEEQHSQASQQDG